MPFLIQYIGVLSVLVNYCYLTNYPQTSWLKIAVLLYLTNLLIRSLRFPVICLFHVVLIEVRWWYSADRRTGLEGLNWFCSHVCHFDGDGWKAGLSCPGELDSLWSSELLE